MRIFCIALLALRASLRRKDGIYRCVFWHDYAALAR
jgi:hypothetical protein